MEADRNCQWIAHHQLMPFAAAATITSLDYLLGMLSLLMKLLCAMVSHATY